MSQAEEAASLRVELGARGYDILVGPGLLERAGMLASPVMRGRRAIVVTDRTVAELHLARLRGGLERPAVAVPEPA